MLKIKQLSTICAHIFAMVSGYDIILVVVVILALGGVLVRMTH